MSYQTVDYDSFLNEKVIPNLDGLRGISIFLVMFHHIPKLSTPFWFNLQVNGRLGVMLFFVISGFLITRLALNEKRKTGTFSLKDFYVRRSLRIFPLYYATLAFVCLLVYAFNVYPPTAREAFSERLPSYLFYYSNLTGPIQGPYSLLWSLAVEEQFYLFFALVFYLLPTVWSAALFFMLTLLRLLMPLWGPHFGDDRLFLVALYYQEAILLGVSLAYLMESRSFYVWFSRCLGNYVSLLVVLALLIVCLIGFSSEKDHWLDTTVNILFLLVVGITAIGTPLFLLGGAVLSHIGKISYGIYLFHTIVFYGVKKYVSDESWVVFCVGVPLTIALATVSYNYFEMYFLKMKRKFSPA